MNEKTRHKKTVTLLPPTIQTTNSGYMPEFGKPGQQKDTRPAFLGGNYVSKVKGESQVKGYLSKTKDWRSLTTKNSDKKKRDASLHAMDDGTMVDHLSGAHDFSIDRYYQQKV